MIAHRLLGGRGMSVLCADLNQSGAGAVARRLPPASRSGAIRLDVSVEAELPIDGGYVL